MGDRASIKVWNSHWLMTSFSFKILKLFLAHSLRVEDLMDPITQSWKVEVLEGILWSRDIDEVKKIPLSPMATPDELIWHYTKMGEFSVHLAYHMGIDFMERENLGN